MSIASIKELPEFVARIRSRQEQVQRLRDTTKFYDVIVIGAGATGAGTALDATLRGLKTACIEGGDFASGTSSRSTKLAHGGVRYLEQAVKELKPELLKLVMEALRERKAFLEMAPHLAEELRLITPIYDHFASVLYYGAGLKLYDMLAGSKRLTPSRIVSKARLMRELPMIKSEGLKGGVEYSDGQFDDSRMNVSLALTAAAHGAAIANHVRVIDLVKSNGKVMGVKVRDEQSGDTFVVRGKVVINATGPFIDGIRKLDDPEAQPMVVPSAGTHIVVNKDLPGFDKGILIPKAPNGSVGFIKPYHGGILVGTTEEKSDITPTPTTTTDQVEYLVKLVNGVLGPNDQVDADDVKAVWTGIRPLVRDPAHTSGDAGKTAKLSRTHVITSSASGLVTIGGGKWTTFAPMAREVVDHAIEQASLSPERESRLGKVKLLGAHGYSSGLSLELGKKYGLAAAVCEHLCHRYGDRAVAVLELAKAGHGVSLHPDHPHLEAEVLYVLRNEYACTPIDILMQRLGLFFIDQAATAAVLPRVVQLMAAELGWTEAKREVELGKARAYFGELQVKSAAPSEAKVLAV